jgi:2-methylcitrate dehydratase PrpD
MDDYNQSPTRILSDYAVGVKYEDIPKEVIESTKMFILDSIGCAVGGSQLEPGKIIVEFFEAMGGLPEATVFATGKKLPLINAAYVNSYLANVLDFDDTYANMAHPATPVIAPALALAEKMRAGGKELLTATVVGYETCLRIGLAIMPTPQRKKQVWGFGTWQIIGTVTAAGRFLKFDSEQMSNAIGLACANAPVPCTRKGGMELAERPRSWPKGNYGWVAMGGVMGAMLTHKGFIGNRFMLDGERGFWVMAGSDQCNFDKMVEGLGEKYLITNTSFKPYASCRWSHSTIDACLKILENHPIEAQAIKSITVKGMYEVVNSLSEKNPKDIIDAQFSIPYLVALCITGNSPAKGLSETHLKDELIQSLAKRVDVELDPKADKLYFENGEIMLATVIIETSDNNRFEESVYYPKGSRANPITYQELESKFLTLTSPVVGESDAEKILGRIKDLENIEDTSGLFVF